MSFPSVSDVAKERGFEPEALTGAIAEEVLLEAVRRDCPEAVKYLHGLAHVAKESSAGEVNWLQDPNSKLGKQLIRIHASDAVRPLVERHICHGMQLTFLNCCGGRVGTPKPKDDEELIRLQIQMQAGPVAYADC
jgi:hypothetical protein